MVILARAELFQVPRVGTTSRPYALMRNDPAHFMVLIFSRLMRSSHYKIFMVECGDEIKS